MRREICVCAAIIAFVNFMLQYNFYMGVASAILAVIFLLINRKLRLTILTFLIFVLQVYNYNDYNNKLSLDGNELEGYVFKIKEYDDYCNLTLYNATLDGKNIGKVILRSNVKVSKFSNIKTNVKRLEFKRATNIGNYDEYVYSKSDGIKGKFKSVGKIVQNENILGNILYNIHNRINIILEKIDNKEVKSLYKSLILNENDENIEGVKNMFSMIGVIHILAISGLHINIISMLIMYILNIFRINLKSRYLLSFLFLLGYLFLIANPISANRAVFMFFFQAIALILKRSYDQLTALSVCALIQMLINPFVITNYAFILSYGICLIVVIINNLKLNKFKSSILITLLSIPLTAYCFYKINFLVLIGTLTVLPIMTFVLYIGFFACISSIFSFYVAVLFIKVGSILAGIQINYIKYVLDLFPSSNIITGKIKFSILIFIYLIAYVLYKYKTKILTKSILVCFMALLLFWRINVGNYIDILDVGQGDCNFIRFGNKSIMIDCGSSSIQEVAKYKIIPYMDYTGVGKIDYVFLSHMHSDHYSGIIELIESRRVKNLVLTNYGIPTEPYLKILHLAKINDVKVVKIEKKQTFRYDDAVIECLHPYKEYVGENPNSYSMTLLLKIDNTKTLFTGDLEAKQEEEISDDIVDKIDILKVAHHGSNTSTTENFLRHITPYYAGISCGLNNKFKHPHKEVIDRLNLHKIETDITSNGGQIRYILGKNIEKIRYGKIK